MSRLLLLIVILECACRLQPLPPPKPLLNCTSVPKIAASCTGVRLDGVSQSCMQCWKTDYYSEDPTQMIRGCYSYELDIYCVNADGCDDGACAPSPVIVPPQLLRAVGDAGAFK